MCHSDRSQISKSGVNNASGWVRFLHVGVVIWAVAGASLWIFLLSPYGVATATCLDPREHNDVLVCLKGVAHELRHDSNLATYATATVAAAIALQLANRGRETRERLPSDNSK